MKKFIYSLMIHAIFNSKRRGKKLIFYGFATALMFIIGVTGLVTWGTYEFIQNQNVQSYSLNLSKDCKDVTRNLIKIELPFQADHIIEKGKNVLSKCLNSISA